MLGLLGRAHDRLTAFGFAGAAGFVGVIALSFWYEVTARYFFSAPTTWAYDVSSYALCPMIFLSMPAMTRRGAHIAVAYLIESFSLRHGKLLERAILLAAALVCLLCAWISGAETLRQYIRDVETIAAFAVPKWWISVFIPYGMLSSAIYFLRQLAGEPQPRAEQDAPP